MKLLLALAGGVLLAGCASTPGGAPRDTLSHVAATKSLAIAYREDSKPFSYKATDGVPTGYSVELCKQVAASIKSDLKLDKMDIKWVPVTVATRLDAITSGRADIECGSTSRTLGREKSVDFSNAIWVDGSSYLTRLAAPLNKVRDLHGKRVGVIPGTTTEQALKMAGARGIVPVLVPLATHTDGVAAVRDGRVDAYATDRLILIGEVAGASPGSERLKLSDDYLSLETYGLVMRRDADFRLAVNRALAGIYRSGDIRPIFRQSFGPGAEPSSMLEAAYILNALPE